MKIIKAYYKLNRRYCPPTQDYIEIMPEEVTDFGITADEMSVPRMAVVLLVDTSGSMNEKGDASQYKKIDYLNMSIDAFIDEARKDEVTNARVDLMIVEFNNNTKDVTVWEKLQNHQGGYELKAGGMTSLGAAVKYAYDLLLKRKEEYRSLGIEHHQRSELIVTTDGVPTDDVSGLRQLVEEMEEREHIQTWALGIPGCDVAKMKSLFTRTFFSKTVDTREIFRWFSQGMMKLSQSKMGEKTPLPALPADTFFVKEVPVGLT